MASSHTQNHTKTLKPKETKPKPNWDTLGQPSGKFDYYVKYSAPPSSTVNVTTPSGWDIPADDNDLPHPAYQYISNGRGVKGSSRVPCPVVPYELGVAQTSSLRIWVVPRNGNLLLVGLLEMGRGVLCTWVQLELGVRV
ncbi:hypothetical protein FEM48_Zijuj02G0210400 [Ziziphus jujuba var. spinosa]|uniref:Uncharacterized protein n=1 Tax=Ziziphus jujuba var. spinosa TaxID=714518 RepID=A0A978VXY0_ZIZJJ|nr:hypothetical protein FEM48_Zijuj02G0210400 [Ziziphus jujuba var. spinosa]